MSLVASGATAAAAYATAGDASRVYRKADISGIGEQRRQREAKRARQHLLFLVPAGDALEMLKEVGMEGAGICRG